MTLEDGAHRHRLAILQRAVLRGSVTQACLEAEISRTLFYRWLRYLGYGAAGLRPRFSVASSLYWCPPWAMARNLTA